MKTFRDIIDLWPTIAALADDLGLKYDRVAQWYKRDSIPGRHFADVVKCAKARHIKVTLEDLSKAASLAPASPAKPTKAHERAA